MAYDSGNLLDEKVRKERVKDSVEYAGIYLPRIGREAYKESYVVTFLRDKYDEKLQELEKLFSESATELALLGEKYRASENEYEKNELVRKGDSIKTSMTRRSTSLRKFNLLFKLFDEFDSLVQTMINEEQYRSVVKVIPEHKLVRYARLPEGDLKLKPLVEKLIKQLESEARKAQIDLIEFEEFKKHQEDVTVEFEKMIEGKMKAVNKGSVRAEWDAPAVEVTVAGAKAENPFEAPSVANEVKDNPFDNTNRS